MLELNKIYNMDCVDGMRLLDDESVDLTVTSPPYDNLRTYNGFSFDFESVAKELYRVTKNGGVVVWVVNDQTIDGSESGTSFRQALFFKEIGFRLHDTMIYKKTALAFPETKRYYQNFEFMFVLSKGEIKTSNLICDRENVSSGRTVSGTDRSADGSIKQKCGLGKEIPPYGVRYNVWEMPNALRGTEHPAVFPEQLAQDHIISWSNENDTVLDPFMGSGTTAKMCILNRRNFIGFEISKEYVEQANARIKPYQDQTTIFDFI